MRLNCLTCSFLVAVVCAVGLIGCGGDQPPTSGAHSPSADAMNGGDASPGASASANSGPARLAPIPATAGPLPPGSASAGLSENIPVPPDGAQWTIYCDTVRGPTHVELSNRLKSDLTTSTGMHSWYLIHHATESSLFYGYYATIQDKNARADKKHIDELEGATKGDKAFKFSQFVPVSSPDPDSPPQWSLENAPPDRFWSLQIAAFRGIPDRKRRAVEAVREARKEGIEAYYYHGDTISSVCIGAWKKSAVVQQGDVNSGRTTDPNSPLMVVNDIVPSNIDTNHLQDRDGKHVVLFAPKLEVDDPDLMRAIKQYPTNAVNGWDTNLRDKNGNLVNSAPSFLVQIPGRESMLQDSEPVPDRQVEGLIDQHPGADAPTARQVENSAPPASADTHQPPAARPSAPPPPAPAKPEDDPTLSKLKTLGEQ